MKTLKFLALVALAIACIVTASATLGCAMIVMPERPHVEEGA